MKEIPGFKTLKAIKHGQYWRIIDCTPGAGDPFRDSIGGYHKTYRGACIFAEIHYGEDYI